MANRFHLLGAAALGASVLASCGTGSGGGSGDASATGAAASGAYKQTPGQYETRIEVTNASLEGFPAEAQQQLNQLRQQPMVQTQCVPIGFSLDSMDLRNMRFSFPNNMGGCNLAELSQTGGNAKMVLNCEIRNLPQRDASMPQAVNIAANFEGTYSENTWNMTGRGDLTVPNDNARKGNIEVRMSSRRLGDCPAQPAYTPPPPTPMPMPSAPDMNSTAPDMNEADPEM
jgi:hypothetical protein